MPILNSIIKWFNIKRTSQIELMCKYPGDVQNDTFLRLISQAQPSEWGHIHRYDEIKSYAQFKERVPIQTYEDIKPWVDRLRKGESELLWPGEVKWFAKSSGTTSDKSKFIPVTNESLEECHFRGGKDVLTLYQINYPDNNLLPGKSLTLGGSHQVNSIDNESYYGDLSAIIIQNIPFWANLIRTPDRETALIEDFEEKLHKIVLQTLQENVTSIAGVPSWNLLLIKKILKESGKTNLLEVWPNLELFVHGGVSFKPYMHLFKELIPSNKMHYMETYNASEGFFAIQDNPNRSDMLLMLDLGVFYEFIPVENVNSDNPKTYTIDEVEMGKNYAIVISTNGGLWRYLIGDTVIFSSLYPHRIKISGRTKHFINAFGEEVIIDNALKAIEVACKVTQAKVLHFTAAPVFMNNNSNGKHEWIIEFDKMPDSIDHFTNALDNALKTINSDYEAKRYKNSVLSMPKVHIAPTGVFYKWMKERGKLGGQNKVPQLSNNRKYVEQLLKIIDE